MSVCDTTQCGACVIHMDGRSVKSCTILAVQASGSDITTIEGISSGDTLHPVQAAFKENHGLQCGFCTPGMVMTAVDMIHRHGGQLDEQPFAMSWKAISVVATATTTS